MSLEQDLLAQRLQRVREIEQLGFAPYGHRFDASHRLPEIISRAGEYTAESLEATRVEVKVCGRLQTIRRMGKAGFANLEQGGAKLQIYVKKDDVSEAGYELYKGLDLGDIIGCEGYLFRTRTGELSVHVGKLIFLSKTLLAMPEKFHGLEDTETRYRQRYLDLLSNPDGREIFLKRAKTVSSLRRQLDAKGFIEVETPMLQSQYGGAAARPFVTHHNALDLDLYLRIAPELNLKRLVVGGLDRVYEINRNFRNEGISTRHNPEFTMLEFYQAYTDYLGLMDLTCELLKQTALDVNGSTLCEWDGQQIDLGHIRRFTMREAVVEFWPEAATQPSLDNVRDPAWLAKHGHKSNAGENLVEIFERVAEHHLIQPTIIYDFPVEVSPLAMRKPSEPALTDRFEVYACGMEIGNAFTELNDPQEQLRRFDMQLGMRERGNDEAHQMDEDYVRALSYGMPPAGGEGIGIDRLVMILTGQKSIRDVILFPLLRPEGAIGLADQLRVLDNPVVKVVENDFNFGLED